jgi:hypothetical protein
MTRHFLQFLIGAFALIHSAAFAAAPETPSAAPAPVLVINGDKVTATGLTPNRSLYILGLSVYTVSHEPRQRHTEAMPRADAHGAFELKMPIVVPEKSLWLLLDLTTGRYTLASGGLPLRMMTFPPNALKSNGLGELRHIESQLVYAEVVWVRPGVGAWQMIAGDGGRFDADGVTDGRTRLSVDDMNPIADSPEHPKKIEKGDTVFIFDGRDLSYCVVEVGK